MNKLCPICKKRVSVNQPHVFHEGQRHHRECWEEYEGQKQMEAMLHARS